MNRALAIGYGLASLGLLTVQPFTRGLFATTVLTTVVACVFWRRAHA